MNFINFIIIILMFCCAMPQSIATSTNIKPIVQISLPTKTQFIGFEGDGLYKNARLYEISRDNQLKTLPQFQIELNKDNTNYLIDGQIGDITGDGLEDLLLIFNDPNKGTTIYGWTIGKGGKITPFNTPALLKKQQKASQPTSSKLIKIYPDKDKELIITFGSPDRKAVIIDYVGQMKQTEEIGEAFLSNLAGPILMDTGDFNKDGLADIFLLNNGEEKFTTTFLSPERTASKTKLSIKQPILDVYCFENHNNQSDKMFLLKNGGLYVESWNQIIPLNIKKPKEIILYNKTTLSVINKRGKIQHYKIDEKEQKILPQNTVTPLFKNNDFTSIDYLILNDNENMILSHNGNSELLYQPIYFNQIAAPEVVENKPKKLAKKPEQTAAENTKNDKTEKNITTNLPKQEILKEQRTTNVVLLGSADTVVVNTGETAKIKLDLNKDYNFIDLTTSSKPEEMNFDIKNLVFYWSPKEDDVGNNILEYSITYAANRGIQKNTSNGKLIIHNKTETIKDNKQYIIYVNHPPEIILEETNYTIQANNQVTFPVFVKDQNKEQTIKTTHNFSLEKGATFKERTFKWTPTTKDYGKHSVTFTAHDGIIKQTATAHIMVDTLKKEIMSKDILITTVNKEFTYNLEKTTPAQFTKTKGPSNLRISPEGFIHWIPIMTQLGMNEISLEAIENKKGFRYSLQIYVNAPPIISFAPDQIEYINKDERFVFQLQSFDQNIEQNLFWSLQKQPAEMKLNNQAEIEFQGKELDFFDYVIQLSDTIDVDVFKGAIYVNDIPKIISAPPQHINLGETLKYAISITDKNKANPQNRKIEKHIQTTLRRGPPRMIISNQKLMWTPKEEDVGPHDIIISGTDGLINVEQKFTLYVNDTPRIITVDSIAVMQGDTLRHRLTAKDLNQKTNLTYSIKSNLKKMMLNASTGEIIWIPTKEDLGTHIIEANVSDGFDTTHEGKQIKIFVYDLPRFLNEPPKEAYVDIEYKYLIEAQDAFGGLIKNEDIFINLMSTTFSDAAFDTTNYAISIFPKKEELGLQTIELSLEDKYNYLFEKKFNINVLMSPCEVVDTLYIKAAPKETQKQIKETQPLEKQEKPKKEKKKTDQTETAEKTETKPQQKKKEKSDSLNGMKTKGFQIPGSPLIQKKEETTDE